MADVCAELQERLSRHEWYHEADAFALWLNGAEGVETCIASGLKRTSENHEWATFEGYVYAATLRPDTRFSATLCEVLDQHDLDINFEDIVEALGEIKDPASVDCLATTLRWEPDWDEFRGLAIKCVAALAAIGTPAAWDILDAAAIEGPAVVRNEVGYVRSR